MHRSPTTSLLEGYSQVKALVYQVLFEPPQPVTTAARGIWASVVAATKGASRFVVTYTLWYTIGKPLVGLYMHGPTLMGYGFWEGRSLPEICSTLTGVDAIYWATEAQSAQCTELVARKAVSYVVRSFTMVIVTVSLYVIAVGTWRYCILNPLLSAIMGRRHARLIDDGSLSTPKPVDTPGATGSRTE